MAASALPWSNQQYQTARPWWSRQPGWSLVAVIGISRRIQWIPSKQLVVVLSLVKLLSCPTLYHMQWQLPNNEHTACKFTEMRLTVKRQAEHLTCFLVRLKCSVRLRVEETDIEESGVIRPAQLLPEIFHSAQLPRRWTSQWFDVTHDAFTPSSHYRYSTQAFKYAKTFHIDW